MQPKQGKLLRLLKATGPDAATIIGFGGAKGGGKSAGVRNCCLDLAYELGNKYPGLTITIVRRVFGDLKDNHIDPFLKAHPELIECYHDKEIQLPNRARILFRFAETPGDVERKFRGGFESAFIFVDEAQQFTERELQDIQMAARWADDSVGIPEGFCKLVLLFNPGGKSSDYLRRIFWTKEYTEKESPANFAFLHVFGWDNYEWFRGQVQIGEATFYKLPSSERFQMFITQTSEGRKYDAFPAPIRAGYLLGSFDHFEGQYFAGAWDPEKNILTPAQVEALIQPWWTRWMAQDWAFAEHASHGWYAAGKLSPSQWMQHFGGKCEYSMDVVIRYREHVIANRPEPEMANDIVSRTPVTERPYISRFFMSQDAFGQRAHNASAHSVGEVYRAIFASHGLPGPEPADQNRIVGWRFTYNCMRQGQLCGTIVSPERAKQGPAFFTNHECPRAISCIPMAIRDDKEPDDVARVAGAEWEDVNDEIRYGLHSMLNPQSKAPRDVRAKELYHSIQGDNPEDVMTERAIAMKKFQQDEAASSRVSRGTRWRD